MGRMIYCAKGHFLDYDHTRVDDDEDEAGWPMVTNWEAERIARKLTHLAFCSECGAESVCACPHCKAAIVVLQLFTDRPSYCSFCGQPFPWTETALRTAAELADESEDLTAEDKATLKASLPALTVDTPETQLSIVRFKKIAAKAGPVIGKGLWEIIKGVAPAIVKDALEGKLHY